MMDNQETNNHRKSRGAPPSAFAEDEIEDTDLEEPEPETEEDAIIAPEDIPDTFAQYRRKPLVRTAPGGVVPPAETCPVCQVICRYELQAETPKPGETPFARRSLCRCEKTRNGGEVRKPVPASQLMPGIIADITGDPAIPSHRHDTKRRGVVVVAEGGHVPSPVVCPACGSTCAYRIENGGRGDRGFFARRPQCLCEKKRALRIEQDAALREEQVRRNLIHRAVQEAKRALVLPERIAEASFENYDADRHRTMREAFLQARTFAEHAAAYFAARHNLVELLPPELQALPVEESPDGLVFLGTTGVGKSHLCAAVCRFLAQYGVLCRFINLQEFFSDLSRNKDRPDGDRPYWEAMEADVVIFDDAGKEYGYPDFIRSRVYGMANYRSNKALPILTTTSLGPDKLQAFYGETTGPSILSRLTGRDWLIVAGPDGRYHKNRRRVL